MKLLIYLLASISALAIASCRHSSDPAPETDVTSGIAGTYGLTKLTVKDAASSAAVTGTGSVTITAVNPTTVNMRVQIKINLGSSSSNTSDTELLYTVNQSGNDYVLTQSGKAYGTVTGKKLTLDIAVRGSPLSSANTYLTGEFMR